MRTRTIAPVACAALLCLGLLGACSDDDDNNNLPDAAADATTDATADAGVGDSVTFIVVELDIVDAVYTPVPGATVAFDAPGGERTQLTGGTDGKVTFDHVDWSQGTAAVTAYAAGYNMRSQVNLTAARIANAHRVDGAVSLVVFSMDPDPAIQRVTLTGSATGFSADTGGYNVNALGVNGATEWAGDIGTDYSIRVPKDEPFTLQAIEGEHVDLPSGQGYALDIQRVMHQTVPAQAAGFTQDINLGAHEMTTYTADASFLLPPRADSPLRLMPMACLVVHHLNALQTSFGWANRLDINPSGDWFDVSFLWTEPTWATDVTHYCIVRSDDEDLLSYRASTGYPVDGTQSTLRDVPTWVDPLDTATDAGLHDPLQWTLNGETSPHVLVRLWRTGRVLWWIEAGPDATTATIPQPPSGTGAGNLISSGQMKANVCSTDLDWTDWTATSESVSRSLELTVP